MYLTFFWKIFFETVNFLGAFGERAFFIFRQIQRPSNMT